MINLKLRNIRKLKDKDYEFKNKTTILIGKNSCGKSTIIESIYYCCFFKSFRTIHSNELINFDEENGYINLNFNNNNIKVNFVKNDTSIQLNQNIVKKSTGLNKINCILISPEQIEIINKGPSLRRDFINRNISQLDKQILNEQITYNTLLKQKNKILKDPKFDELLYNTLTSQMNVLNEKLVNNKIQYLKKLEESANKIVKWITNESEEIELNYKKLEMHEKYIKEREIKYQSTVIGNHLDDIEILLNDISLKKYGSQGQKRTVIISLILGQMDLIYKKDNKYPIVLIDDIHAELDSTRQLKLNQLLESKTQTIIAVVEKEMINKKIIDNKNTEIIKIN